MDGGLVLVGPAISTTLLPTADKFSSPFGETPLDRESAQFLCTQASWCFATVELFVICFAQPGNIRFDYRYHYGEHSAENELPFVQYTLPGVPLVVALIGEQSVRPESYFHACVLRNNTGTPGHSAPSRIASVALPRSHPSLLC